MLLLRDFVREGASLSCYSAPRKGPVASVPCVGIRGSGLAAVGFNQSSGGLRIEGRVYALGEASFA